MRKIMKLHFILLILLLNTFYLQSAELTIEGYGTDKMSPTYNYDKDKMFMVWTAKTQNFTNLGIRSVGSCGGTMEIINGVNNQNILCESKNDYGTFYILSRNSKGDAQSNTQKIIFLAGTGIWTEFVGAECTGAYSGAQESHFMWKGKCKVPDSVMENAKNRMMNFKKEN